MTIWLYATALVQAGQVVTRDDRAWASRVNSKAQQEKEEAGVGSTNSITVLYFDNKTGQKNLDVLQKGMAVMLISDLSKIDKIQVVERVKLQALLEEMGLAGTVPLSQGTSRKIARMLGTYYVSSGYIVPGKFTKIQLHPSMMDVPFKTVKRQDIIVGEINELYRIEKDVLFNIIKDMNISITPEEQERLSKPLSKNDIALLALFTAIDFSDRGQYDKAAAFYREALVEDPDLHMAGDGLQELQRLGLLKPGADDYTTGSSGDNEHYSTEVLLGVGAGLILIGSAIAISAGGGSGSDSSSNDSQTSTTNPTGQTDTTSPTAAAVTGSGGGSVHCQGDSIRYVFSENMDTSSGSVTVSPASWSIDTAGWENNTTFLITWNSGEENKCLNSSVTTILQGFKDLAGNALDPNSRTFEFGSVIN